MSVSFLRRGPSKIVVCLLASFLRKAQKGKEGLCKLSQVGWELAQSPGKPPLGPPGSCPFSPRFWLGGFPYQNGLPKTVGTSILFSLEDLRTKPILPSRPTCLAFAAPAIGAPGGSGRTVASGRRAVALWALARPRKPV